MFQYLTHNTPVNYSGGNELVAAEEQRLPAEMFCHQALSEFENNIEAVGKVPISCSKIQVIAKELKYQGNKSDLPPTEIKPHSTPATLLWLEKNYELAEGICIPRNTLYSHYIHFCKSNSMSPLNSASFGKIIRQAFPSLTTRRLGTRGQSRYHYYGIAIKDTSPYYDIAFSKMSFTCLLTLSALKASRNLLKKFQPLRNYKGLYDIFKFSIIQKTSEIIPRIDKLPVHCVLYTNTVLYLGSDYDFFMLWGTAITLTRNKETLKLWPQFPNMKDISFPPHVSQEKITSFIIMYHTHCQRMFDIIVRGTLDDAYQFLEHFWQGVPSHLSDLLNTNTVVNMVGVCDSILYRTINRVLMPSVLKSGSESLIHMIRNFADKLENWISSALSNVPPNLKSVKLKLGKRFCTTLRRQIVLYQLTHTAQIVFNNCDMMNHINKDWKKINLGPIMKQALLFTESTNEHVETIKYIKDYWENFQELIERQATIEDFTERLENLVHRCVVEMSKKKQILLQKVARPFILLWHVMESLISRDMTIHSAASFGSFHLIQTMFDEYTHYLVEMLHSEDVTKYLLKNVTLDVLPDLDSNGSGFNESFAILETSSNLRSIANLSGGSLEVIQTDFQTNSLSFYSGGSDFSKINLPQSDCSFMNTPCEYQNQRKGEPETKYNSSNSFSEAIQLSDFNACDQECVEFSAGIYCQEDLQYNVQSLQYQNSSYSEGNSFECLE